MGTVVGWGLLTPEAAQQFAQGYSLQAKRDSLGAVSETFPDAFTLLSAPLSDVPAHVSQCIFTQEITSLLHIFMLWLTICFGERERKLLLREVVLNLRQVLLRCCEE